jgi:hypothetical protein
LDEENPTDACLAQENGFWLRIIGQADVAGKGRSSSSAVHLQRRV